MGGKIKSYVVGLGVVLGGCQSDGAEPPLRAPPEAVPASVQVGNSSVTVGTKLGSHGKQVTVGSFRVSLTPTSVKEYQQCLSAGACSAPDLALGACVHGEKIDGPTYGLKNSAELPVTCVRPEQASAYCHWVGARLPRIEEWLLAARGQAIRRFAWGDEGPTCDRHWRHSFSAADQCPETGDGFRLGTRTPGASPSGVLDILTTRGELIATSREAATPACRGKSGACVAAGLVPGGIDFFLPLPAKASAGTEMIPASGFRCVWEIR